MAHRIGLLALASLFAVACSSSQTTDEGSTESAAQALTGGCRIVCPKCHPGEVCPMIACVEDCHGKPTKCVENQLCPIGYAWSQAACSCVPSN
ncbi:MAG: hypothetical protein U0235_13810 [Polyangiaceae bacterium]